MCFEKWPRALLDENTRLNPEDLDLWYPRVTMFEDSHVVNKRSIRARLSTMRRRFRALTIWHPYGRAYTNPRWWRQLIRAALISPEISRQKTSEEATHLIFTCDLELDPPWETGSWDQRGYRGLIEGLPRLLDLLDAHKIRGTFFTEGVLARVSPEAVLEVAQRGHEVGCHGLAHESYGGPYRIDETIPRPAVLKGRTAKEATVRKAKDLLEELIGVPIRCFRAPFLHIDSEGSAAVANAGFLADSSLQNHLFGYLSAPMHLDPGEPLSRPRGNLPPHGLIEIPVSVDPQPRLRSHHPYGLVDQGPRPRSVLDRIVAASALAGVAPTMVLLVHTWEFVEGFPSPLGHLHGAARAKLIDDLLNSLGEIAPVRPVTMGAFASRWEQSRCPWHADGPSGEPPRSTD